MRQVLGGSHTLVLPLTGYEPWFIEEDRAMRAILFAAVVAIMLSIVMPVAASAQSGTTGAIAGMVTDTTGAVLPGVTVEAASPALIEKVRTALTDAQGRYQVVELRPGTYTVTFTLSGFSTVKREGIELST